MSERGIAITWVGLMLALAVISWPAALVVLALSAVFAIAGTVAKR